MVIIDINLLNSISAQALESPRLRMNYNFHHSLEDKCHRFLNAVEPGTIVPIHRHPTKDEGIIVLKGKVRVTTYNDDGEVMEAVVLNHEDGQLGVDIPKNIWHTVECIDSAVLYECKEGPYVPHEIDGILELSKI